MVNTNNRTTIVAMNNNKPTLGLFNNKKPKLKIHFGVGADFAKF